MTRLAVLLALALAGCGVQATGTLVVTAHATTATSPPPQDRVETPPPKAGFVWIHGSWNYQAGQWTWIDGHWERERPGYRHDRGRWEQRDRQWVWIEGTWVTSGAAREPRDHRDPPHTPSDHEGHARPEVRDHPTAAPPPARVENHGAAKAGFVWMPGRWDWRAGQWAWIDGHWERERPNESWVTGRWELQGTYYVWIDGHWTAGRPAVRDHRK
jgi:hypothetical protein